MEHIYNQKDEQELEQMEVHIDHKDSHNDDNEDLI